MLIDDFMPVYDVSDSVAIVVHADLATTWQALLQVDLIEVGRKRPLVGALGALRLLPEIVTHWMHGESLPAQPVSLRLRDLPSLPAAKGGWTLLGERPQEEIALGLVGKFWRPVIEYVDVAANGFKAFHEPGYAKTVYSLSVRHLEEHQTLLAGAMRTQTTDDNARTWFQRYWTFGVGSGAHVLVNGLLEVTREKAESLVVAA